MILNLIAQNKHDQSLCNQILNSHEMPSEPILIENLESQLEVLNFVGVPEKTENQTENYFKFKMQDIDQIERGVHCTKGNIIFVKVFIVNGYIHLQLSVIFGNTIKH